jgi:ribose transport system ATP-binding protein
VPDVAGLATARDDLVRQPAPPRPAVDHDAGVEMTSPILKMTGVRHSFGAVRALDGVDFELLPGEVMALLGENGAGKSTLVKIMGGLIDPDAGTITVAGEHTHIGSPRRARELGIAVSSQEPSVVGALSAAENVFLGGVPFAGPWASRRLARAARPFLASAGLEDLDPLTSVGSLSVARRQLVELARLLARDARILILDEPTAALADNEIELVKRTVTRLAGEGLSVVYVTHRLGEVFEIADRVTVMRNGQVRLRAATATLTMDAVVEQIVGRHLDEMYPPRSRAIGDVALRVEGLSLHGLEAPVSFDVHAGEIMGLAGQTGSGNGLLLRAIAGVTPAEHGHVRLGAAVLPPAHTLRRAMRSGLAYCSADRKLDGIFAELAVAANLSAPAVDRISRAGWISRAAEARMASEIAGRFALSRSRLRHPAGTLSGGNQQKVALGKWLSISPKVLLVEEPTRGVDVGARAEIYRHLRSLAESGLAVLFASTDLDEVSGLSDTVGTLFRGRLVRLAAAANLTQEELLHDITHEATA